MYITYTQVKSAGFERDPVMREYGLRVHNKMEEIEGRVLDPPAIKYKGNETVRSQHYYLHVPLRVWVDLCTCKWFLPLMGRPVLNLYNMQVQHVQVYSSKAEIILLLYNMHVLTRSVLEMEPGTCATVSSSMVLRSMSGQWLFAIIILVDSHIHRRRKISGQHNIHVCTYMCTYPCRGL